MAVPTLREFIARKATEHEIFQIAAVVQAYWMGHLDDRQLLLALEAIYEKEANQLSVDDFTAAFLEAQAHRETV